MGKGKDAYRVTVLSERFVMVNTGNWEMQSILVVDKHGKYIYGLHVAVDQNFLHNNSWA